ncbi:unnamed protein product [Pylaiella littoralis]
MKAAFGAETAGLWSELFETRRASLTHAAGFSRLLRALAKDCGRCALSAGETEEAALVGSGTSPSNDGDRENSSGLGLVFSQTQPPTQQQLTSKRDDQRERDVGRGNDKDAVASKTIQRGKPAQAAARSVQRSSSSSSSEASLKWGQDQGGSGVLSPPPHFFSLPVLTAAALALLTATSQELDAKSRLRAWKVGLATLAWTLTSTTANIFPRPLTPAPPAPPAPPPLSGTPLSSAKAIGAEEGAMAIGETCRCLGAVRSSMAAAAIASRGEHWSSRTILPLEEDTLAPVCRLLAVAVSRSYAAAATATAAAQDASSGSSSRASSSAAAAQTEAACVGAVAAFPSVRGEIRSLVVDVWSAVTGFRAELLAALSPMLEAVLDTPLSKCGDR